MDATTIKVKMLGRFSVGLGDREIDDNENRSRKVWLLLAYMIYCRKRTISQEELISLLWGDEESSSNPVNALKTMFHRVRSMLNLLGDSVGHDLIVRQGGSYAWNTGVPLTFDVEEFDELCRTAAAESDPELRLERYLKAVGLYQGNFLIKLATEPWVVPISAYYHNLYIQAVQETVPVLESRGRLDDAVKLCRKALNVEPYDEGLYQHLMRDLLDLGDHKGTIAVYEEMSELLFANFGIMPSEEVRAIYREAIRTVNDRAIPMGVVREQLKEPTSAAGALMCEYDFFKVLYHAEARAIARNGDAVHIALLSALGEDGKDLPKRSLDRVMENLLEVIRSNLRRGDVAARCSVSQYIMMLPQANYENSCMVCDRVVKAFCRQYPHSPAKLTYSVQPLEPSV